MLKALVCLLVLNLVFSTVKADEKINSKYLIKIEKNWLKMKDGVSLAVTYFKPLKKTSTDEKFPVLLEYLPYRKDDLFYQRDYPLYTYFAERGFIMAKVDIRGTGSSEGQIPSREYSDEEIEDALEIIDQLSHIPDSNGNIGMWGKSWGGINSIQVAMKQPAHLKAILAVEASDDLYRDDIHYIDGAFHIDEFILSMETDLILPKSPGYLLDSDYFKNRFDTDPWFLTYMKNQKDGKFWKDKSLRWNYDKIQIPVYLIGGLLDGYRDSVPRMLQNVKAPVQAVMGPWNHSMPHNGTPGPNYEWRHELVQWWNYWLKDHHTKKMTHSDLEESRFAVFVREGDSPNPRLQTTSGHWRYEKWPISRTVWKKYYPAAHHQLTEFPGSNAAEALKYQPGSGIEAGYWWGEPTGDMDPADRASLYFDSPPLGEKIEIIGFPKIKLRTSVSAPMAHWVARLEDVWPDGQVSLITGGILNGSQRISSENPSFLIPFQDTDLEFDLHFTTWTFQLGHKIRLALSNASFPMIWPTPFSMTSILNTGSDKTQLMLPVIPYEKRPVPHFQRPENSLEAPSTQSILDEPILMPHKVEQDFVTGVTKVESEGKSIFDIGKVRYTSSEKMLFSTKQDTPANSEFLGEANTIVQSANRELEVKVKLDVHSDMNYFHVKLKREVSENKKLVKKKIWEDKIPRVFQ